MKVEGASDKEIFMSNIIVNNNKEHPISQKHKFPKISHPCKFYHYVLAGEFSRFLWVYNSSNKSLRFGYQRKVKECIG